METECNDLQNIENPFNLTMQQFTCSVSVAEVRFDTEDIWYSSETLW